MDTTTGLPLSSVYKPMANEAQSGEVMYSILNFECIDPRHFNPEVPARLSEIIIKLLRKDRDERYSNVVELHEALASRLLRL